MAGSEATNYELIGSAAWITLDAPAARNALSAGMVSELAGHLRSATDDPRVRAIVLTGAGTAFCAGADLKSGGDMGRPSGGGNSFVEVLRLMRDGPKPVVAAVNGHAFGGGLGLVAAADIAIGVESAKFSFSEVRIGVIPAMISIVVLPKIGEHHAMRLFLTGERFSAEQACVYGLLHRAVPGEKLKETVEQEISAIARGGPNAVREAKLLVRTIPHLSEDEAFEYAEKRIAALFSSEEAAEGMAAFVEKRPAKWVKKD